MDCHVTLFTASMKYTVLCTSLHLVLRPVVRLFPNIGKSSRGDWINRYVAIIHALYAGGRCFLALLNEAPFNQMVYNILTLHSGPIDYTIGVSHTFGEVLP